MYSIEVLLSNPSLATAAKTAMDSLNALQEEFRFFFPSAALQAQAQLLQSTSYITSNLFAWLRQYRINAKGSHPHILLIVDGPLASPRLANLFGSHEAVEGLAIFTTNDSGRFVQDIVRFIRYYLVRYSLSFVAPTIRSHVEPERRDCFFHKKLYKPELLASLNSGVICDADRLLLREHWTPSIKDAIEVMAKLVAEDLPYALVMKGGGVKGLAFASAAEVLGHYFSFDVFAGTSAGSIAAVLFGFGYSPEEVQTELSALDFRRFRDATFVRALWNLAIHRGLYPGNTLTEWVDNRLRVKTKLPMPAPILLDDKRKPWRLIIYAASSKHGLLTFDSVGDRRSTEAAFAVRCSASIPYFFIPKRIDDSHVFDGGMRENFPLQRFIDTTGLKRVIGLFLTPPIRRRSLVFSELVDIITSGNETAALLEHTDKIVAINTHPIRTTDFDLTSLDKEFLLSCGRAAALKYVYSRGVDDAPDEATVAAAEKNAEELRARVAATRGRCRGLPHN